MTIPLLAALARPAAFAHPVASVEVMETHISWVLLAGDYAYKIKKPVVLPFADFGTLTARRHYCDEELRLNRRLAPQIYLGVVPIAGNPDSPTMDGDGTVLEYAVKMRRFSQDDLFDQLLAHGALRVELLDNLARRIAAFHACVPATMDEAFGTPEKVLQPALDNFSEMAPYAGAGRRARLDALEAWTRDAFERLKPVFAARHRGGRVRECHGDLHLRNIVLLDGEPVPFDCIEFSAELRWIDVMSEVAFLVMDLLDRARPDLAYRFLDSYLAEAGDYAGVAVLVFYIVYRALVRAKIHDLRGRQASTDPVEAQRLQAAADHYLKLADEVAHGDKPALILMHGFSGAGKSRVAASLAGAIGAIRLRSDVERKRLFGLGAAARSHSPVNAGIYGRTASTRTYAHLAELAATTLASGHPVVVDAAFLARGQRKPMRELALRLRVPFLIVDCAADIDVLRQRVIARAARGDDASEATIEVLEHQLATYEPLTAVEQQHLVHCNTEGHEADTVAACVARVVQRLAASPSTATRHVEGG